MNNESIRKIADFYGFAEQSRQLAEECAELIVAVNKAYRFDKNWNIKDGIWCETIRSIAEEIADVEVMLIQLKYLLNITDADIHKIKEYKVNRQIERINNGLEWLRSGRSVEYIWLNEWKAS